MSELRQTQSSLYDANGALAEKSNLQGQTRYRYDGAGRLQRVELPNHDLIYYVHDALGRRIGKVKKSGTTVSLVKGWLYADGLRPIAQLNSSGAVESTFVYATRANVPDYVVKGGTAYRVIADHLGTPRLIVNVASGAIVYRLALDEFGKVLSEYVDPTLGRLLPHGFAGGLWDSETGLVRFGARDYDPETGRWTARDPILFGGGQANLYAYVGNDPINRRDPNGLFVVQVAGGLIGAGFNAYGAYERGARGWDLAAAAAFGAGTGVLGTLGTGAAVGFLVGATTSAANSAFNDHLLGCSVDYDAAMKSALLGGAGAALGGAWAAQRAVNPDDILVNAHIWDVIAPHDRLFSSNLATQLNMSTDLAAQLVGSIGAFYDLL